MKKILSAFVVFILILSISASVFAIDLSGMSYNELMDLRTQVNNALMNSGNLKEVKVPQGVYEIGKDIPAGKWYIKDENEDRYASIFTYESADMVSYSDYMQLNPDVNVMFHDGQFIDLSATAIFSSGYSGFDFSSVENTQTSAMASSSDYEYQDYLEIENLDVARDGDYAYIAGVIRNTGVKHADLVKCRCTFVDSSDFTVDLDYAFVTDIAPGESVPFKVVVPFDQRMHSGKVTIIDVYLGRMI